VIARQMFGKEKVLLPKKGSISPCSRGGEGFKHWGKRGEKKEKNKIGIEYRRERESEANFRGGAPINFPKGSGTEVREGRIEVQ